MKFAERKSWVLAILSVPKIYPLAIYDPWKFFTKSENEDKRVLGNHVVVISASSSSFGYCGRWLGVPYCPQLVFDMYVSDKEETK